MAILVLAILLAAWGLVLGPAFLRQSLEPSPIHTEMMFRRALKAIGGPKRTRGVIGGRSVLVPPKSSYPLSPVGGGVPGEPGRRPQTAAERRRRNLTYLAGFIVATFLLGLLIPPLGFLLYLNIVADVILVAYLGAVLYFAAKPVSERLEQPTYDEPATRPEAAGGGF